MTRSDSKRKPLPLERAARYRYFVVLIVVIIFAAGCDAVKRAAYEGVDRDSWQYPARVIKSLNIRPGSRVADLGSGDGYFTFRLARAVGPEGGVYAVDIDKDRNEHVAKQAREEGLKNIEVILAEKNDPLLPATGVDLIFASNSYHHLEDRTKYFAAVKKYLRPNGRVAIIDFRKGAFRHFTESSVIRNEMQAAGYRLQKEYDFLPRQHFLIFSPSGT